MGFRFTARGLAQRYAVTGRVGNLADGRVELLVCGEEREVEGYLEALRGRMGDYIAGEERREATLAERPGTFDIQF